jgi:S-DNA-T family DNA segregation ATPase FtsK/SpoIIIE
MNGGYFRVRAKAKKSAPKEIKGISALIVAAALLYCMVMPESSGMIGREFARWFFRIFGQASFVLPLMLGAYGVQILRDRKSKTVEIFVAALLFLFICGFAGVAGLLRNTNYGGLTGKFVREFFIKLFGPVTAGIVLAAAITYLISMLLRISITELVKKFFERVSNDIREWRSNLELSKKMTVPTRRQSDLPKKVTLPGPRIMGMRQESASAAAGAGFSQSPESIRGATARPPEVTASVPVQAQTPVTAKPAAAPSKEVRPKQKKPETDASPKEQPAAVPAAFPDYSAYKLPQVEMLHRGSEAGEEYKHDELIAKAALLEKTLASFGVMAKVEDINPGPTITRYDLTPETGVKVQQITALSNDIALAMKTISIRIIAPVPGKAAVGIEIPNSRGRLVSLGDIISTPEFRESKSKLSIALGQTIDGKPCVANIISMPHLLIAGATGSGKSVCIHSIITSVLYKARPDEVKLLLIDPKRLELPVYNGLPHLFDPTVHSNDVQVITQPKHAARALAKLVKVMEKRYEKFAKAMVRNIEGYNEYALKNSIEREHYILVIIDELADLILMLQKEVEDTIQRLAQMARAVGIHLILATQRPSVDVITGVIKANLSARIAFQVLSKTDSRVILDTMGAEDLLGFGDMLYLATGEPKPVRLQGAYISEPELNEIVNFIKKQDFKPHYDEISVRIAEEEKSKDDEAVRDYIVQGLKLILERRRVSQDLLKALFGSSARASDVLSMLEVRGFIFKPEGTNKWSIQFDKIEEYLREVGA